MTYRVKEAFYSIQGEGARAGRPAVFCRFSGCNLWSGRESDRAKAACAFCDTDFLGTDGEGGGRFDSAQNLSRHLATLLPQGRGGRPYLVLTGGEPALQLDEALVSALHARGFELAVETNGSLPLPGGLDWITVSPKPGVPLALNSGDELKLVYPAGLDPADFEELDFRHFFLQPLDDDAHRDNTRAALLYCLDHPRWRLSLQIHKILGLR